MNKKNVIVVGAPHSMVDLITNSSTELFIIDRNKTQEVYKEILETVLNTPDIDYDTTVCKWKDYEYKNDIILPEETNMRDLRNFYVIEANRHNNLLNALIREYFYVVPIKYKPYTM